jgi:ABC-2 type transport system ATP-binding protein
MIACSSLTKRFAQRTAVDSVSFQIAAGEICSILGPNGAGKSTLIRMLCGLIPPDGGSATVAGFNPVKQIQDLRRNIGVVPDNLALLPELTIEEQLTMSGPIYGLDSRTTHHRSEQLLKLFDIWTTRRTFARECSHGMRKKTALAMALLHNPKVLILDEPFEGIDPASAETIRLLLKAIAGRGITILLTSHILSLVDRISDRVILIRDGRVMWNSPVSELPHTAESLYFELVEPPAFGDLEWLHSPPS